MRILIAEDERVSRRLLETTLRKWGNEVIVTCDGTEALEVLQGEDSPKLAIIDWMMPEMDGVTVCREVRQQVSVDPVYIILLTALGKKEDIVEGFKAGADDYITKPFNHQELKARVQAGARIVELQYNLSERIKELEAAFRQVTQLEGMLPICSYCKKVRGDDNYWQQVEQYVTDRTDAKFSHSVCPDCEEKFVKPQFEKVAKELAATKQED
ncbi:response regulator [candidate division LCP-89 bacterium B3_LCP]|uniref:Response regulator n=1 Tax=candidate division LCP-89 bacterium B3_LCP TaxID=2012998 RepID=A0A532V4R4_UNCL8|nr:MAG: response regulator [candidate division LCP-89 bacterium B3_LCP]